MRFESDPGRSFRMQTSLPVHTRATVYVPRCAERIYAWTAR